MSPREPTPEVVAPPSGDAVGAVVPAVGGARVERAVRARFVAGSCSGILRACACMLVTSAAALGTLVAMPGNAGAEVVVEGDATALTVKAEGESLTEVADEIAAHLEIDLTVPPDLESAGINGTYRGSLASVLKGLMPHASFIVSRRTGDSRGVIVRFLGVTENSEAASARPSGRRDEETQQGDPENGGPPADRKPGFNGRRAAPEGEGDAQSRALNNLRRQNPQPPPARQVY